MLRLWVYRGRWWLAVGSRWQRPMGSGRDLLIACCCVKQHVPLGLQIGNLWIGVPAQDDSLDWVLDSISRNLRTFCPPQINYLVPGS